MSDTLQQQLDAALASAKNYKTELDALNPRADQLTQQVNTLQLSLRTQQDMAAEANAKLVVEQAAHQQAVVTARAQADQAATANAAQVQTLTARATAAETELANERHSHAATRTNRDAIISAHNRMAAANSTALKALMDSATQVIQPIPGTTTPAQPIPTI